MHFSFQSESFLIFVLVFVKKVYAISVHNDNLSFTKTKQCINKGNLQKHLSNKKHLMQKKFTTVCEISKLNSSIFFYREIINDSVSVVSLNLHRYIREVVVCNYHL